MKLSVKKVVKKVIIFAFILYFGITIYSQQKKLESYKENIIAVKSEIEEKESYKNSLISLKENANSPEYIEKIAREKLNMYKPNEKVYIDVGN